MHPKKYPSGNWGIQKNNSGDFEDSLAKRARLQKNLIHFVGIGELCEQFAIDLAKKAGVRHG